MQRFRFLFFASFMLAVSHISAQKTEDDYASSKSEKVKPDLPKPTFRERLVIGGNVGGYFGNNSYFQLNPMVGYKTTSWWVNGVGLNYIYASGSGLRQNVMGASVWTRAYILKSLILHSELEMLQVSRSNQRGESASYQVPVWFVGAGYQSRTNGGGFSVMVLYDLIQDPQSPYSTPVFRVGGLFGF